MRWAYGSLLFVVNMGLVPAMAAEPVTILALGDSLTAGYMLGADDAFPAKLERALKARGYQVRVINAGVSGDTTSGGRARLGWALADKPQRAIVELGANDALRGIDPALARANLEAIVETLQKQGVSVFLAGMMAPRNLGPDYIRAFDAIYPDLQRKYGVPLYPFFLDGVLQKPGLTLADGMHPSPKGVDVIVAGILPAIERWLGPPPGQPGPAAQTP